MITTTQLVEQENRVLAQTDLASFRREQAKLDRMYEARAEAHREASRQVQAQIEREKAATEAIRALYLAGRWEQSQELVRAAGEHERMDRERAKIQARQTATTAGVNA